MATRSSNVPDQRALAASPPWVGSQACSSLLNRYRGVGVIGNGALDGMSTEMLLVSEINVSTTCWKGLLLRVGLTTASMATGPKGAPVKMACHGASTRRLSTCRRENNSIRLLCSCLLCFRLGTRNALLYAIVIQTCS